MQSNNKKICIVASSLGKGGAERSTALLSEMLSDLGYKIHIVTVLNIIDYKFSGELLNLGNLKEKNSSFFGRFKRLQVFAKYLKTHNFDFIIDNRSRNSLFREFVISKIIYRNYNVIYVIHSFNLNYYFPKNRWLTRFFYKKAYALVSVSNEIKEEIKVKYKLGNVINIYNSIEPIEIKEEKSIYKGDYILAYGRLDEQVKNYTLLFTAYKKSILSEKNIKLVVLGSGKDSDFLKKLTSKLNISSFVDFIPFEKNPFELVRKAKFVCLTSRFEGFPRVLIEALSLGTPVISVNCKSGPKEIIKHKFNGLLVNKYNESAFAEAMNKFILDEDLYAYCKLNAKASVRKFSMQSIANDWDNLLKSV